MAMQHRQQHGKPVGLQPHTDPSRITEMGGIHQRLQLHQQGPSAFPDHRHQGTGGDLIRPVEEDGGGVLHFLQALTGHGKHAQLVHRPETVLQATQGTETGIRGAFQHQ